MLACPQRTCSRCALSSLLKPFSSPLSSPPLRLPSDPDLALDALGALTRLDYVTPDWPVCDQYLLPDKTLLDPTLFDSKEPGSAYVSRLRLGTHKDLEHQTRLTKELFRARPQIDRLAGGSRSFTSYVESTLSAPVSLTSSGPTAFQKHIRMYYALTTYR